MRFLVMLSLLGAFGAAEISAQTPDSSTSAPARKVRENRWQITLVNDSLLWDVRLVGLADDRLSYRQADSVGVVKVGEIHDLRLFQASELQLGTAGAAFGALSGADDIVFDLGTMDFAEKLRAVQQIVQRYPP